MKMTEKDMFRTFDLMGDNKELRLDNFTLWNLCAKNSWFTCGTNEQYEELFRINKDMKMPYSTVLVIIYICSSNVSIKDIFDKICMKIEEEVTSTPERELLYRLSEYGYELKFDKNSKKYILYDLQHEEVESKDFFNDISYNLLRNIFGDRLDKDLSQLSKVDVSELLYLVNERERQNEIDSNGIRNDYEDDRGL